MVRLRLDRRLQVLLDALGPTAREPLRLRRAVAVLEQIGTPAAREVLEGVARRVPETVLTREAKASLGRLAR